MEPVSSLLELVGLALVVTGVWLWLGVPAGLIAGGVSLVLLGLSLDPRGDG